MTGTYRSKTGFFGLTDMPADCQKAMDYALIGLENTFCFLDDILIVSKGSDEDHFKLLTIFLRKHEADYLYKFTQLLCSKTRSLVVRI